MSDQVSSVLIVGGGDAGLINALRLEQCDELDVTVVDDFSSEPPQVGKATSSGILPQLHNILEVDRYEFARNVKPVWKLGVKFDWFDREFFQPFGEVEGTDAEEMQYMYEEAELPVLTQPLWEDRSTPFLDDGDGLPPFYPRVGYHLDTKRFNPYLRERCRERAGVELVDDEIVNVETEDGRITAVASEDERYTADLYIDATGFNRALIESVDADFRSFDCTFDSAVVGLADIEMDEVEPATHHITGEEGWFWQIDTYTGRDVGFVYSSEMTDDEAATERLLNQFDDDDLDKEDVYVHRFDSGAYRRVWVENCIAVGNASGFVEPLEALALTAHIRIAHMLGSLLEDHRGHVTDDVREAYNEPVWEIWNEAGTYIATRYGQFSDEEPWQTNGSMGSDKDYYDHYDKAGLGFDRDEPTDLDIGGGDADTHKLFFLLSGLPSSFHEEADVEVGEDTRRMMEEEMRELRETADSTYSYEEIYDVLDEHAE